MLDEHKDYLNGIEISSVPDITTNEGRTISSKQYEYVLAYTDEPQMSIGIVSVLLGEVGGQ